MPMLEADAEAGVDDKSGDVCWCAGEANALPVKTSLILLASARSGSYDRCGAELLAVTLARLRLPIVAARVLGKYNSEPSNLEQTTTQLIGAD